MDIPLLVIRLMLIIFYQINKNWIPVWWRTLYGLTKHFFSGPGLWNTRLTTNSRCTLNLQTLAKPHCEPVERYTPILPLLDLTYHWRTIDEALSLFKVTQVREMMRAAQFASSFSVCARQRWSKVVGFAGDLQITHKLAQFFVKCQNGFDDAFGKGTILERDFKIQCSAVLWIKTNDTKQSDDRKLVI